MFDIFYRAVCERCQDMCDDGGTSKSGAVIAARQHGWQADAKQWIFGGVETDWDFYCPTHRVDWQ